MDDSVEAGAPGAYAGDEDELWTCIAYDPGGTTGWGLLALYPEALNPGYRILDNVVFWTCGQFVGSAVSQGRQMALLAAAWPTAHIVMEDFILRAFRQDRILLEPVRVISSFEASLAALETAICCGNWAKHNCQNNIDLSEYPARSTHYFLQQPSLAMSTMTDERLRAAEEAALSVRAGNGAGTGSGGVGGAGLGFFSATRGLPHARDAVRHMLTFARREAQARSRGTSLCGPAGSE